MVIDISDINKSIFSNPEAFVRSTDGEYYARVQALADHIASHRNERPIVLLSGPSGSGKTTTAMMIEKILDGRDFETHTLSMDNFFRSLSTSEFERAARGEMDLESPARIDIDLLNDALSKIIACQKVEIPRYDFKRAARVPGEPLCRRPGEIIILEGIHALNPDVVTIPDENTERIYISVRTRVSTDSTIAHPSMIRLMRRMIRDRRGRGRTLEETFGMYPLVDEGEKRYIMPYKHRSTFDVDTFIAYELNVYKSFLHESLPSSPCFDDLREVLEHTDALDEKYVPKTSLIREFIGNGQFKY